MNNVKLEELEFWITKERDNAEALKHDVMIGKHQGGMSAAYTRVLEKIERMKREGEE